MLLIHQKDVFAYGTTGEDRNECAYKIFFESVKAAVENSPSFLIDLVDADLHT